MEFKHIKRPHIWAYDYMIENNYIEEVVNNPTINSEFKSIEISLDNDGNFKLTNKVRDDFDEAFTKIFDNIQIYLTNDNYDMVKFELARLKFLVHMIDTKIISIKFDQDREASVTKNTIVLFRMESVKLLDKYTKQVIKHDKNFVLQDYYDKSIFKARENEKVRSRRVFIINL